MDRALVVHSHSLEKLSLVKLVFGFWWTTFSSSSHSTDPDLYNLEVWNSPRLIPDLHDVVNAVLTFCSKVNVSMEDFQIRPSQSHSTIWACRCHLLETGSPIGKRPCWLAEVLHVSCPARSSWPFQYILPYEHAILKWFLPQDLKTQNCIYIYLHQYNIFYI